MNRSRRFRFIPLVLLALAALSMPRPSHADPIAWSDPAGGNWNTPANGSPPQVPTGAD